MGTRPPHPGGPWPGLLPARLGALGDTRLGTQHSGPSLASFACQWSGCSLNPHPEWTPQTRWGLWSRGRVRVRGDETRGRGFLQGRVGLGTGSHRTACSSHLAQSLCVPKPPFPSLENRGGDFWGPFLPSRSGGCFSFQKVWGSCIWSRRGREQHLEPTPIF